jgi:predicted nuclease with RNAse H fold
LNDDGVSVSVRDYGTGKDGPWFDEQLLGYLRGHHPDAVLAIDAPLTLTSCVRCVEPSCPGFANCVDPEVIWFRERAALLPRGKKPTYTPYTQRPTEVVLHEDHKILPRETLGQGMGPLTARAAHLTRALAPEFVLNRNLIEVYPKATITRLFSPRLASRYKRSGDAPQTRLDIWNNLRDLKFAPGAWREDGLQNDHKFDAVICAYTAYLWAQGKCLAPPSVELGQRGWIWMPEMSSGTAN